MKERPDENQKKLEERYEGNQKEELKAMAIILVTRPSPLSLLVKTTR